VGRTFKKRFRSTWSAVRWMRKYLSIVDCTCFNVKYYKTLSRDHKKTYHHIEGSYLLPNKE
jgi:hypothetical protein